MGDCASTYRHMKTEMTTRQYNIAKIFGEHESQSKEVLFFTRTAQPDKQG